MAWWIHCNACGVLFCKETEQYMLSCKHILCCKCFDKTDKSTCPIDNSKIRFHNVSKMPKEMKEKFFKDPAKLFEEPLKIWEFQQAQINDLTKKTAEYQIKTQKGREALAKKQKENEKAKAELEQLIKQRKKMQEKLREIYNKQVLERKSQQYRSQSRPLSESFSTSSRRTSNSTTSGYANQTCSSISALRRSSVDGSGFFEDTRQKSSSSSNDDIFASAFASCKVAERPSKSQMKRSQSFGNVTKVSQSRPPFFA